MPGSDAYRMDGSGAYRMDGSGAWLLPGEQTLWTGRPAPTWTTLAGGALFTALAVIVIAVAGPSILRGLPANFHVIALPVLGATALGAVGMLINLLVIKPKTRRPTVYEVTNYRVIVSRGGRVASVYLDQIDEPVVRRSLTGTSDLRLRSRPRGQLTLADMSGSNDFRLGTPDIVTELPALADADSARQVLAEARLRMLRREIGPLALPAYRPAPPAGLWLGPGESVLWTGGATRIPWWFGGKDVYDSTFGLVVLALVVGIVFVGVPAYARPATLVFLPAALFGVYLAAGRVVVRRLRIRRSSYILTTHRLITTWPMMLAPNIPVVVQEWLYALLPPTLKDGSVLTGRVTQSPPGRFNGFRYKELTWPATTVAPPAFIGLEDPQRVCELIGAAQLATRVAGITG